MQTFLLFIAVLASVELVGGTILPRESPRAPIAEESVEAGPMRMKAEEYDDWNAKYHHPYYGGMVAVTFRDVNYQHVSYYSSIGDSCIWTGTYLASQAMKYKVTKDPKAKENILKSVRALHGYLHVTNTSGYIARYWGPRDPLVYGVVQEFGFVS